METKQRLVYASVLTDAAGRRINEDAVYSCTSAEADKIASHGYLYIVADGTGAQEGGQTASSMATAIIAEHFYDNDSPDVSENLRRAIKTAHEALHELAQKITAWAEMSTTVVAAVIHEGQLYIAHVGDSRAYLVRDGEARLLTRDHVWLKDDDNYGALTRWLGGGQLSSVQVDVVTEPLKENDIVVLCSDGLTDVVDREDIQSLVSKSPPQAAAKQLLDLANRRQTGDNVSVGVIQYGGKVPAAAWKRWVWIGGGGTAAFLLTVVLALVLIHRPGGSDSNYNHPTSTPFERPGQIILENTATLTPTAAVLAPAATREPTSTPMPVTPTPTPRPTRPVVPVSPATVAPEATVPSQVPPPEPPPPPPPTQPPR